jgi:retron-type reverse transcriptase
VGDYIAVFWPYLIALCFKIGLNISDAYGIDNGIPQGGALSPVLLNNLINDVFSNVGKGIGTCLYAEDGAIWKRRRNISHVNFYSTSDIGC